MTKDEAHDIAFDALLSVGIQDGVFVKDIKAAYIGGTGTGKSKVGCSATEYVCHYLKNLKGVEFKPKILILVHNTRLRDFGWKDEFEKWGTDYLWEYVTIECYQTVYKWEDTHWDLVIADEGDFSLTEEYSKFYKNNTYDNLIFLTATLTTEKRLMLRDICPIVREYSTVDAQNDGVLNTSSFFIIEFDLDRKNKNIPVEYKKNNKKYVFYQTENDKYQYLHERVENALMKLQIAQQELRKLEMQSLVVKDKSVLRNITAKAMDVTAKIKSLEISFYRAAGNRKTFLHSLESTRKASKSLVKAILDKDPSNKVLVFSKTAAQIDKTLKYTYHSANEVDNNNLELFNKGEIRYLGVVDKLNRGENIVGVNYILKQEYVGSPTEFQQQHGRGTRLSVEDELKFYVLVPCWHRKIETNGVISWKREYTQAKKWQEEMVSDFNLSSAKTFKLNIK